MGYAEKRGRFWRARWRLANGKLDGLSGFTSKTGAEKYANRQEALISEGLYVDPRAGRILFSEWAERWYAGLDLELSSMDNTRYYLERFAMPEFGERPIASIAPEEVALWEKTIGTKYSARTAKGARTTLSICLGDAVPTRIPRNPAVRPRARGKIAPRRIARVQQQQRAWATPLQALLIAERVATLSGRDEDFLRVVVPAWTAMRWSEIGGLGPGNLHGDTWQVESKLYELNGLYYRGAPKDGSIRTIDVPPFLRALIEAHLERQKTTHCKCRPTKDPYCPGLDYVFLNSAHGHTSRSDFSRRYFRPAADGWYPQEGGRRPGSPVTRPALPVLADVTACWPGVPLPPWPTAERGKVFEPPAANGYRRRPGSIPVNSRSSKAELVAYATVQGVDPAEAKRLTREDLLDRYVRVTYLAAGQSTPRASWLPVVAKLTPHGLRHAQETWMAEDRIPDVLRDDRVGHEGKGSMRDLYTHITDGMRGELVDALERRWAQALAERAAMESLWPAPDGSSLRSPVALLNELLQPHRTITRLDDARRDRRRLQARAAPRLLPNSDIGPMERGRSQKGNGL